MYFQIPTPDPIPGHPTVPPFHDVPPPLIGDPPSERPPDHAPNEHPDRDVDAGAVHVRHPEQASSRAKRLGARPVPTERWTG